MLRVILSSDKDDSCLLLLGWISIHPSIIRKDDPYNPVRVILSYGKYR